VGQATVPEKASFPGEAPTVPGDAGALHADACSLGVLLPLGRGASLSVCSLVARVTSPERRRRRFGSDDARSVTELVSVFADLRAPLAQDLRLRDDVVRRQKRGGRTRDQMLSDGSGQVAPTAWAEVAIAAEEVVELTGLERDPAPCTVGHRVLPAGLKQKRALPRRQHGL